MVGRHRGQKFIERVLKINASTKSLVERQCDFKIYAISVLSFTGSVCALDKATLETENHALQCTTAARKTLYHLHFLWLALFVALALIWWAFIALASRLAIELQHARPRFAEVLKRSARLEDIIALLFSLSPVWKKEFSLVQSMAFGTANAFDIVCRLDRNDTLEEVPQIKRQKVATGPLLDQLRKQDFASPLSSRASRVLGPISRHRVADMLPHMKSVSRASRPGLLVGFLRILCNGLCTAQRFHTEEHDHTCRIGCANELVFHTTMSVPGCTFCWFLSGDMLRYCHKKIFFYMT